MDTADCSKWVKQQYPNGVIDWQAEHARLLEVAAQAIQSPDSLAVQSILRTAVQVGEYLQDQNS